MSTISTYVACNSVQDSLINAWGYDNNKLGNLNLTRFLLAPINKNDTINTAINFRPNGLRDFVVTYGQRFIESDVTTGGRITCDTGSDDGITSTTYTIDPTDGARHKVTFTTSDLLYMCESNPSYVAGEIKKLMDVVIRKFETDLAISVLANGGNFASDVIDGNPAGTTTQVNGATLLSGGGISTNLIQNISFESMANEYSVMPYVFGGEKLSNYAAALGAACCGDLGVDAGVYATNQGIKLAYSDRITMNAGNADDLIAIVPGSVQLLHFNEFIGQNGNINYINDDSIKQGVLAYPDPTIPLTFDYRAEYTCDGSGAKTWTFEVALNYAFAYLPTDMYKVGDQLEGVNGLNSYRIVNP